MFSLTTNGIKISVKAVFVPENSQPEKNYYAYAYEIAIKNKSSISVQLLRRHWIITDAYGRKHEVKGDGVIGQQPILEPDGVYSYQSWCPLSTKFGSMQGSYTMISLNNEELFEAQIPKFTLVHPELEN